jgi:predicted nucleic acid-binding protein
MRVYFNTSALSRSFDDLSSTRVRLEADAVVALVHAGLRGLDALHVASAEAGAAELLVTTDDRMMRTAGQASAGLRVRVVTPPEAVEILTSRRRR